jgi:hypothetical protein
MPTSCVKYVLYIVYSRDLLKKGGRLRVRKFYVTFPTLMLGEIGLQRRGVGVG